MYHEDANIGSVVGVKKMGESTSNVKDPVDLSIEQARHQFAAWLRAARERSGLSIEAIAQETKISKNYISSLEAGSLEALPGKVFGRGFVKNITRLLKSDGAEGLRLYDACWGRAPVDIPVSSEASFETEPHKTRSVMARIAEPVDVSSEVTRRLINPHFTPAGESPKLPGGKLPSLLSSAWGHAARLSRRLSNPHVRLGVFASIALALVLMVFGRWAAVNIHKVHFPLSSGQAQKSSLVTKPVKADRSLPMNSGRPVEVQSQEAVAIADAATSVRAVDAPVPAAAVSNLESAKMDGLNQAPDSVSTGSRSADQIAPQVGAVESTPVKNHVDVSEDDPLYAPSTSGAAFEQVVELNVSEAVEVRMLLDGKKVDKTWFEAKSHRFSFNDRAEIYILDASKLDMVYNGKSLGALGSPGRKRRIILQAKASAIDFPR